MPALVASRIGEQMVRERWAEAKMGFILSYHTCQIFELGDSSIVIFHPDESEVLQASVDFPHQKDLLTHLRIVTLVDAHLVDPETIGMLQQEWYCSIQSLSYWQMFRVYAKFAVLTWILSPCVRHRGIKWCLIKLDMDEIEDQRDP
jgi:hypothetical protein